MQDSRLKCLMISVFLLCLISGNAHAWFQDSSPENHRKLPIFEDRIHNDFPTGTFILMPNESGTGSTALIPGGASKRESISSADKIDIDIPFNLLFKTEIRTENAIDRQITANLRLKNILDHYAEMRQKTEKLLDDLRIPYLDGSIKRQKLDENDLREQDIRQKISDVLFLRTNSWDRSRLYVQNISGSDGAGESIGKKKRVLNPYQLTNLSGQNLKRDSDVRNIKPSYTQNNLPWVVRTLLKFLRYAYHNKLELSLWLGFGVASLSIGIWVARR